jgi:hypothetical protein
MFEGVLRPFMRAWSSAVDGRRQSVPRPADAPLGQGPGPDPDRILILGNGVTLGWGVRTHDLALTGQVARELATLTGHGTDVLTLASADATIETIGGLLSGLRLDRYDAVVVVAGMSDAVSLLPLRRWHRAVGTLLDDLIAAASPLTEIVMMGLQPVRSVSIYSGWPGAIAQHHATAMNASTKALCVTRSRVTFSEFPAPSAPPSRPGHRTPGIYQDWGRHIAQTLSPVLSEGGPRDRLHAARNGADSEAARQEALDGMHVLDTPDDARLQRITRVARDLFATRYAAVNLIDRGRQWPKSQIGIDLPEMPRSSSVCDHTIRQDGVTVFGDLWAEDMFRDNSAVHHGDGLRFYAGCPINSPDGYRIGAICVIDPDPRDPSVVDEPALRALAHEVEKELWLEAHASVSAAVIK